MANIPLISLQTAVYSTLSTDVTLSALGCDVLDWVPENQSYPYVTIGEYSQETDETKDSSFSEVTMEFGCWSSQRSMDEVNSIMDAVVDALTASTPTLTGGYAALGKGVFVTATAVVAEDVNGTIIRHGTVQIGWIIRKT